MTLRGLPRHPFLSRREFGKSALVLPDALEDREHAGTLRRYRVRGDDRRQNLRGASRGRAQAMGKEARPVDQGEPGGGKELCAGGYDRWNARQARSAGNNCLENEYRRWRRLEPRVRPRIGICIVLGGKDGAVHALSLSRGARLWRFPADSAVDGSPACGRDAIFIGSEKGTLYSLSFDGSLRWKRDVGGAVRSKPLIAGAAVFVTTYTAELVAIDAASGEPAGEFRAVVADLLISWDRRKAPLFRLQWRRVSCGAARSVGRVPEGRGVDRQRGFAARRNRPKRPGPPCHRISDLLSCGRNGGFSAMKGLMQKLFGDRKTRLMSRVVDEIAAVKEWAERYRELGEADFPKKTEEFASRIRDGETLDQLLPEAYGLAYEACRRLVGRTWDVVGHPITWDMVPFDAQIAGAIILHQGKIAEMATGEGKTLVATMPLYLNALAKKGAHLVTVNDYLARRDAEWMGEIYRFPRRERRISAERDGNGGSPARLRERYHVRHQQRIRFRLSPG